MLLVLTLVAPGSESVDVTVDAPDCACLGTVADELTRAAGRPGADLYAGAVPLSLAVPLGTGPLRSGGLLGVGAPVPGRRRPSGVLELHVVGGPDAGGVHVLRQGTATIGRDHTADIPIADPDVSRRHVEIAVTFEAVTVHDLGSTNGAMLDGEPIGPTPVAFPPGAMLLIGATQLTLAVPADPPALVRPGPDGWHVVNLPPRLAAHPEPAEIRLPAEPAQRAPSKVPVLGAVLPCALGVGMAILMHALQYLLFSLLSPVMLVAGAISERRGLRHGRRRELVRYRQERSAALQRLDDAVRKDARAQRVESPDLALIWRTATGPGQRLWERRPGDRDAFRLRLGTSDRPARVVVRSGDAINPEPPPRAASVPVTVSFREAGIIGISGPAPPAGALARALVAQLATLHSPRHLSLALLADDDAADRWSWTRWLPHLAGEACVRVGLTAEQRAARVGELLRLLDARMPEDRFSASEWAGPRTIVVVDGAAAVREMPGMARVLAEGPAVGIHAICIDQEPRLLPAECGALVSVAGEVGTLGRLQVGGGDVVDDIVLDGANTCWAEEVARALAPLRDGGGGADGLPASSRLLPLLGIEPPTTSGVRRAWRRCGRTTRAVIGESIEGPFAIDLARDGPHALVAGTTGAGKSELLQTMIASLAASNRPDAMTFVLIDYKGGAAFKDCVHLPHTVGMVTDLDGHLTERALASLGAELKRRERLLAGVGAKDIEDYWAATSSDPAAERLPRLALVIDEFATLVEELPDFVNGLVGIAMRGRSLGVHLILATQRPSGAVSPVIRANTNLRIALRVTDDSESRDIIDDGIAALIAKTTPGRAFGRIGAESAVEFQSARVGGQSPRSSAPSRVVTRLPWQALGSAPASRVDPDGEAPTDLQRLVAAIRLAAEAEGLLEQRSPWLPPLPEITVLDTIGAAADALAYGIADHPDQQRRGTASLDLANGGSMLVAGSARSGRSSVLRALLAAAATHFGPDELHCYVIDCAGGALLPADGLPHCGAVCPQHDVVRGDRVVRRLSEEVGRRQAVLARNGYSSVTEQRAHAPADERLPWLLLMIDGWEGFTAAYDDVDHGRPVETVLRLVRDGSAAGVRVIVTGDRQLLSGRIASAFTSRLVLRLADSGDYLLAGLPSRGLPENTPPGRGVLCQGPADAPVEVQVALLDTDASGPRQVAALRGIATHANARAVDPGRLPFHVRPLPERVSASSLTRPDNCRPLWTLIGAAGDDATVAGIDLAVDGPGFLIAGPSRSGRSTALCTIAECFLDRGTPVALVAPRRSPLHGLAGRLGVAGVFGSHDAERLDAAIRAEPVAILVDDVHTMTDAPVGDVLGEVLCTDDGRRAVIAAGRNDELGVIFRGPSVAVRRSRSGLLLQPGPGDGDLLGVRLPRMSSSTVPGRGVLIVAGEATPVQVALSDPPPDQGLAGVAGAGTIQPAGEVGREPLALVR